MNIEHLLDSAQEMIDSSTKKPRQTDLRRATSNVYYALFHALALTSANQLAGVTKKGSPAWIRVYRSLTHTKAKDELVRKDVKLIATEIDEFAVLFTQLQELRHTADYDPSPFVLKKQQVLLFVKQARTVIKNLGGLDSDLKTQLAAVLLLKGRN